MGEPVVHVDDDLLGVEVLPSGQIIADPCDVAFSRLNPDLKLNFKELWR